MGVLWSKSANRVCKILDWCLDHNQECSVTLSGGAYTVDCMDVIPQVQLAYANRGVCDWQPPYEVTR